MDKYQGVEHRKQKNKLKKNQAEMDGTIKRNSKLED